MTPNQNKAIVQQLLEEAVNNGNLSIIDDVVHPDFVYHSDPQFNGPEGIKQLVMMYRNAFPDVTVTIEEQVAEGDLCVTLFTGRGTHTGELMGIAPTGKSVTVANLSMIRFADGKAIEEWELTDQMGMMQQIGALPEPGAQVH